MPTSIFCSQTLPDFIQKECGTELGGIIAIALIDRDLSPSLTDLSTLSFWTQKIAASPQKIWPITDTRGSYSGGTPVEEDGYGKTVKIRTGADHEANIEVRSVADNRNFWAIANQTDKWNVALITNGGQGLYFEDVSVYAKVMIEQNIKSTIRWNVNFKWADDMSNPVLFDATPMGPTIFNN